jgi:hypothetical protein
LGFVRIADDKGDSGESSEFFGDALSIATGYDNFRDRILCVDLADGIARLRIGGGSNSTGVDDHDFGLLRAGRNTAAAFEQLALDGSSVCLRGAATELLDVEASHAQA